MDSLLKPNSNLNTKALMEKGDYSKADHYFNKAIEKDPIDGNLYVHRGILYLQWNNDVDKAVNYLGLSIHLRNKIVFIYKT